MQPSEYDVIISDGEERTGFMLDNSASSPSTRAKKTPPLQAGVEADTIYSARDTEPPYPIEYNDWRAGAGQRLFDGENARKNAFYFSSNVAVHQEGELQIGPARWLFPYDTNDGATTVGKISNLALTHSKLWAAFSKAAGDAAGTQIRRLTHYTKAQSGASYLSTTSATTLTFADCTGITVKCFAYCAQHGEIIRIDACTTGSCTVVRGLGGTTAAVHTAGETWTIMRWETAAWSASAPTLPCVALATDGDKVYASMHTVGSADGDVYRGKAAGTETADWVQYSTADGIVDMTFCGGTMYGVQAGYTASVLTDIKVGYFAGGTLPVAFTTIVGNAVLYPASTHVALVELDNYVYWVVSNPSRSYVYRVQHSTADTFELVASLPRGFTATCAYAQQGIVFVGGYSDTGYLYAADTTHRIEGAVYAIVDGSNITKLCKIDGPDDEDYSVVALGATNRFLDILTKEAVYRYDLEVGGYHHYADVPTTTGTVSGGGVTWSTESWDAASTHIPNYGSHPDDFTKAESAMPNLSTTYYPAADPYPAAREFVIDVKNEWVNYYKDDAGLTSSCTAKIVVAAPVSQAGFFHISDTAKVARVRFYGKNSGEWFYFRLMKTGGDYVEAGPYNPLYYYDVWVTLDPTNGARLWVNNSLLATVAYADLLDINDSGATYVHSKRVCFGPGWPGYGLATDSVPEYVIFASVQWTNAGAYPPDYVGGSAVTASKVITSLAGEQYMPMPDSYLAFITPRLQAASGELDTSETTVKSGTKKKRFSSIDVVHDQLQTGQSLVITPVVDNMVLSGGVIAGPSTDETPLVTSTVVVNAQGRKIRVKLELADSSPARSVAQRLHVYNITAFFTTLPSNGKRSFVLNVSDQAQMRNGDYWDVDPDLAIERLYAMVGNYVAVESVHGDFNAYVESVEGIGGPSDLTRGSHQRGRYQITLTEQT